MKYVSQILYMAGGPKVLTCSYSTQFINANSDHNYDTSMLISMNKSKSMYVCEGKR